MNKKTIIVIALAVLFLVIFAFISGRISKKQEVQYVETNTDKQIRISDSLKREIRLRNDSVFILKHTVDSLKLLRLIDNNIKVKNAVKTIKGFTFTTRRRWDDSVLRANGLK